MNIDSKILVAGANGMVGKAIVRNLKKKGYLNIIEGTRNQVDFSNQNSVYDYFSIKEPEYVFAAAAKVGGILGNKTHPADYIYQNLMIQNNLIHYSNYFNIKKLLFLGSSCIYPKYPNHMPILEEDFLGGYLEESNKSYAIAKIAGIQMCKAYREQYGLNAISLMPCNLYGPEDNFDLNNSHVLPGLIHKFHSSLNKDKSWEVKLWGDGSSKREFLHVDDLAEACYICMISYNDSEIINVGSGEDISIKDLSELIINIIGYSGSVNWDTSKPNGTPKKVMNVNKIKNLGWSPKIDLRSGIYNTYQWYKKNINSLRMV